mmetsp:Transcript_49156/g.107138  ORF Transcript_49156/g.107138 Transcript_49156/m.107138 type:complete len:314 (-) Transcript_49156:639-1580(-)
MVEDLNNVPGQQVTRLEELARHLVEVNTLLQKLASHHTEIALRRLVDADTVVEQMIVDHEAPLGVFRLGIYKPGCEPEDLPILRHHLVEILLRHLRDQGQHRPHRIVPGAETSVRRSWRPIRLLIRQAHVNLINELLAQMLPKEGPGELITVVNKETVPHQLQALTHEKIVNIKVLVRGPHCVGWSPHFRSAILGQFATTEEDWEIVSPTIQGVLFANLHSVVGQEEKEGKWPPLVLSGRHIIHHAEEPAHLPVVLHELLLILVDVTAAKRHLAEELLVGPLHSGWACHHAFTSSLVKEISGDLLRHGLVHPD